MKGIVLAGGLGTRLDPLTRIMNKHVLPVGKDPMIFHPIRELVETGIEDVFVVVGGPTPGDVVRLVGSGKDLGCRVTYRCQDGNGGIAEALSLAEGWADGDDVCVVLGDNVFDASLRPMIERFDGMREIGQSAMVALRTMRESEATRFGVARKPMTGAGLGTFLLGGGIVEKPKEPPTPYAVVGIYLYDCFVFDRIRKLAPSERGELEVTDLNNSYAAEGRLYGHELRGEWSDAGTFESLQEANRIAMRSGR